MTAHATPAWATSPGLGSIALVATDLDGTFLGTDERVSERTKRAAHDAAEAGVELVLVTGRPPRWLLPVIEELELRPTCVCANGAIVLETAEPRVTYVGGLANDLVLHVAEVLCEVVPSVGFAIETAPYADNVFAHSLTFAHDLTYRPRWHPPADLVIAPLPELLSDRPVIKLLARNEERAHQSVIDTIVANARRELTGLVEITHSEQGHLLLEISALGVDKGSGLARVAAEKGVGREHIAAVGDMINDVPMLEWAGHPYAVGNAHELLLDIGVVLPTNDEHAVAQLIEAIVAARSAAR